MSPREIREDIFSCDYCGSQETAPVGPEWLEVSRPSPVTSWSDWWQEPRYFCGKACLRRRLAQEEI